MGGEVDGEIARVTVIASARTWSIYRRNARHARQSELAQGSSVKERARVRIAGRGLMVGYAWGIVAHVAAECDEELVDGGEFFRTTNVKGDRSRIEVGGMVGRRRRAVIHRLRIA